MAHSLLRPHSDMPSPRNDEDLICSCQHPACTIASPRRGASAARARASAVPEPLPFDLSDTVVSPIAYPVPAPPPAILLPRPRVATQRVA